ncbi:flagellar P-ring protein precursor FlgI [Pseudobacteriovorax antillogorgiicola]|uniref:Flagellar P-ring protein n=2 Tax=Pseudobacteriovorax antillogorgiicola TaxID=1513793 RepID=A0A1Y6B6Z4_9BACT|nr:flagellar P-ring protein precursor FlgI [Pseudobacteriovorax antillogorgiicola]SME87831.1 flagellar P-ring protein precursor FlgI [Pseudobacteriovorax antillogorgiicola]
MQVRLLILLFLVWRGELSLGQESRIKDLVMIKGNRTNELMGIGLVVGLNATGDSPASTTTSDAMRTLLNRLGMDPGDNAVITQASAAVVVTAQLPPFARNGDQLDVKLSVIGDATSLAGGTLLMTPLKAGDGNVYAIARGPIIIGPANGEGVESLTVAHIPNGGQIERDFIPNIVRQGKLDLSLQTPDFTTSSRITKAINTFFREFIAQSTDASLVQVRIPSRYKDKIVEFISQLERLSVEVDQKAIVVLNERTGTVVMGAEVKISPIVLSHKGLSIEVGEGQGAETMVELKGSTVGDLVKSLNAMGVQPSDLVSILQSIHASGALRAELRYL